MLDHIPSPEYLDHGLHVVTVYYGHSERNATWLRLQQEFLCRTTKNYKFSVYLNNCDESLFEDVDIIGVAPADLPKNASENHLYCLKELVKLIDRDCDTCLILDSDCFPISIDWQELLIKNMATHGCNVAAPIRVENLDLFPHPCAMFVTIDGMRSIEMILSNCDNLIGVKRQEPTCSLPVFPLLRTNKTNIHSIGAAIYYDAFYHHGAGSRPDFFDNIGDSSYFTDDNPEWESSFARLSADPIGFLNSLGSINI